jgi:hypothetical protein
MRVREVIIGDRIFLEIVDSDDGPNRQKEREHSSSGVVIADLVPDAYKRGK